MGVISSVAFVLACLGVDAGLAPPSRAAADDPLTGTTRVLVLGDSVAHGHAGDWTWRYRLERWMAEQGAAVDMVGPHQGLHDDPPGSEPPVLDSLAYADPDFDMDHASRWGLMLEKQEFPVAQLVTRHAPDVVVVALGFNDVYYGRDLGVTEDLLRQLVVDARTVDPEIDVVLVTATQTWARNVPEFNDRVVALATSLDTAPARVVVARADEGYRIEETWDRSHPNAAGELRIAAAVADAMAELGVGAPYPRPWPEVPLGPRIPPVLETVAGDGRVVLTWERSPGATSHRIWRRELGVSDGEQLLDEVPGSAWTDDDVVNAHSYAYRLQPVKGTDAASSDAWSEEVTARPLSDVPQGAPELSVTGAAHQSVTVTWQDDLGVDDYLVWWQDTTQPGWRVRGVTGRHVVLEGLRAGALHEFQVSALGRQGVGPRSELKAVLVPGTPPVPPTATLVSVDPGGTAHLTWPAQQDVTEWSVALEGTGETWPELPRLPGEQTSLLLPALRSGSVVHVRLRGHIDLVDGPEGVVRVQVPVVGPARRAWIRQMNERRVRTRVGRIPWAETYEVAVVRTRRCGVRPADRRFRVVGRARPTTERTLRARGGAVWVRWRGLRDGVPGSLGAGSYACRQLRT